MEALLRNEAARARLALIWKRRAVGEHDATARFAAYGHRLRAMGAPQGFQDLTFESSEQELRHKAVCEEVAHRLGAGDIVYQDPQHSSTELTDPANMLSDMAGLGCITETINVAQLSTALRGITEHSMRVATRAILADEVKHSRLGWAYLTWARSQGEGDHLSQHLPRMLSEAIPAEVYAETPPHPEAALLLSMGDPPMQQRREVLFHTVTEVILPGFEANGISTEAAQEWIANPRWPVTAAGAHTKGKTQ